MTFFYSARTEKKKNYHFSKLLRQNWHFLNCWDKIVIFKKTGTKLALCREIFLFWLCKDWALDIFDFLPSWLYKDVKNSYRASRETYNWRENQEEEKIKLTSSRFLHFSLQLSASLFLLPLFLDSFYYSWCIFLQLC